MRPGQKVRKTPGASFGVKVVEPGFPSAAGGWWDDFGDPAIAACVVGAYQGRNAANYLTSLVNLPNPGVNDLVELGGGPPGWNPAQGWFNFLALARCFDTGLIPATDQSWSMLVQYDNVIGINGILAGSGPGINLYFFLQPSRGGAGVAYANGNFVQVAPPLATGNVGVAGNQGYRNGVADGGAIGPWALPNSIAIYLGAMNWMGAPLLHIDADIWAAAIYNCTLTAPQMLAVAGNMAAL